MPMYEYQCDSCRHTFELRQKFSDAPASQCPACGGAVRRLISQTAFSLKGGGWFAEGYGEKSSPAPSCSGNGGGGCAGCPSAA